jgi:fimbrial chaperone protein
MPRSSGRSLSRSLALVLLGLALGQAEQASAAALGISPVKIVLSTSSRSALVTLTNKGDEESRVEVSVSAWSEDATGKAVLEGSDDLAVFPLLVAIPARAERRIRVGLARREAAIVTERSYRLFLQELPASNATAEETGVRMVMRFSLPVYVQPAKPEARLSLGDCVVEGGHVRFRLANTGNAHARIDEAVLTGKDPAGSTVFTRSLDLRVLLAGSRRELDHALLPDECRRSATLQLRMLAQGKTLSAAAELQPSSCGR